MGRPLKVIDWKTVVNLCELQCTGEEIASVIEVDYDTLNTACKREHGKSFSDYFEEKRAGGKVSLRRAQFKTATEDGNPAMLIWLGKQMLGQKDISRQENTGPDGKRLAMTVTYRKWTSADAKPGGKST